jgi:hypothetical protein
MAGATGEFSFKAITATYSPGPAGGVLSQVNWEGTYSGFGTVFSTITFSGGPKGGSYSLCEQAFMDDGEVLSAIGQGTYEAVGKHRWRSRGVTQILDNGRRFRADGEIDLASRSWKGTFSELS